MVKTKVSIIKISLLFVALLFSCGCSNKSILKSNEKTSQNTPIVDRGESSFNLNSISMISTPNSTCFSEIGYDSYSEILCVTFRDSQQTYLYEDFSYNNWLDFKESESLGSYYNSYIKGYYSCYKWGE